MGGSGAPLAFVVSRQQCALPLFQKRLGLILSRSLLLAVPGDGASDVDVRRLGAWLEQELYKQYTVALAPGVRPAIAEPPKSASPGFTEAEKATLYNIAGYLLTVVEKRLVQQDNNEWARELVSNCSLPLATAREKKLPLEKVEWASLGGLRYANKEFFEFVCSIEAVYIHNLTDSHLDAFPMTLAMEIKELLLERATEPRRLLRVDVARCLPLSTFSAHAEPPPEVYELIIKKYSMLRAKDLARRLDQAHAGVRALDASAGGVPHRQYIASQTAGARAKAATAGSTTPLFPSVDPGDYLKGRHVSVKWGDVEMEAESEGEAGKVIGEAWIGGSITGVRGQEIVEEMRENGKPAKKRRMGRVADVAWDNGDEPCWFELRDTPYWHGDTPGSWFLA